MKLLIEVDKSIYSDLMAKIKYESIMSPLQKAVVHGIKFADEIASEMEHRGTIDTPDGCMNGEDYEKWLYGKPLDSVLDEMSAEIEEIETYDGLYIDRAYVLQIIDKYKAESKGKG